MTDLPRPIVRAVHCEHTASDEAVYQALVRANEPLSAAWKRLANARRITIKMNQAWDPARRPLYLGRYQELVDPAVARAVLRLLRERTTAELRCVEIATMIRGRDDLSFDQAQNLRDVFAEFGVVIENGNTAPHGLYPVPGGGSMFRQYQLPSIAVETDAFVTVQKIKNHKFMGVTLGLKNLFGLPPYDPYGRPRQYFHHLVRLPHVLVDLGRIIDPALTILDGLTCQSGGEWGGDGLVGDTLLAGDQVIATDAVATHLMGHDPLGDWPNQPFVRDRNALLLAHQSGFGTACLNEIDWTSEVQAPIGQFLTTVTDPPERVLAWRRSTCEQALYYRDHIESFVERYAGQWVLIQNNQVVWQSSEPALPASRRILAGGDEDAALFFKYVDPEEAEGEHWEVYERELEAMGR
ncbi:MAG: DUF362 domain-containing protein [Anaerolineae bacterium]|jgi:hypothetical protein|nr:DUF362 domain-containing protein [Chloroflexota bacterium]